MPRSAPSLLDQSLPGFLSATGPEPVLVNGDGQTVAGPSGSGATASIAPAALATTASPSPFVINIIYDASVANAPPGFVAGVQAAVQYLESVITDPVTITIAVGYGEVGGNPLATNALGASLSYMVPISYTALAAAVPGLPAADPTGGGAFWLTTAEARALGVLGPSAAIDGYIGFSSQAVFDFDPADGITAGSYDFFAVAVHEITEVMGRILLAGSTIGTTTNSYTLLDLFHYAASGVPSLTAGTAGYFSPNGGVSDLGNFNTIAGADAGDWNTAMGSDAFNAFTQAGVVGMVSSADLAVLNALGWKLAATTTALARPAGINAVGLAVNGGGQAASTLAPGVAIATITQTGGPAGDLYGYALAGAGGRLTLNQTGNSAQLAVGPNGLAGKVNGAGYLLSVTATDTTTGQSAPAAPLGVVVGSGGSDLINVATTLGGTPAPAFVYGLAGRDTLNGTGMTSALWLDGGPGADIMTGGSGANTYLYAAISDSTPRAMDIITNFNPGTDLINLSGLGVALTVVGPIPGKTLPADSIGWQVQGGNTFVYVNTSSSSESLGRADMKIELQGGIALGPGNFAHA